MPIPMPMSLPQQLSPHLMSSQHQHLNHTSALQSHGLSHPHGQSSYHESMKASIAAYKQLMDQGFGFQTTPTLNNNFYATK
jgi:hypothetical protein